MPPTRVFGKVDLERPEFQCESSSVVSFIPLDSKFVIHKMMDGRVVFNATYQARGGWVGWCLWPAEGTSREAWWARARFC